MGDDALTSQFAREDILEASFRSGEPYRFAAMSAAMHQYYVRKGEANKARALLGRCSKAISNPEGCSLFTLEVAKHGDAALVARTLEQNELLNVESRVRQGFEYLLHASAPAIGRELDALQQADRAASIFGDLTWPLHRAVALERAERYGEAANVYLTCGATVYARAMRRRRWHVGRPRQVSGQLTARQWEVAKLCQAGLRNHEIASRMGITLGTVEFHVHNVLRELNVTSRHELRALLLQGSESR
jgi:DNA-binding CsgD family transcriptional regulator